MIRWKVTRKFKKPTKHPEMLENFARRMRLREMDIHFWLKREAEYNNYDTEKVKMLYERRLEELEDGK